MSTMRWTDDLPSALRGNVTVAAAVPRCDLFSLFSLALSLLKSLHPSDLFASLFYLSFRLAIG